MRLPLRDLESKWLVGRDIHRSGQESTFRPDHLEVGARLVGRLSLTIERDAVGTSIIHIELQVQEPCLARVENAQAIASCFDARFGIHSAVGEHGIAEHLWDNRGIGRQALWMGSQLPAILLVFVWIPQAAHACWGRARSDPCPRCQVQRKSCPG